MLDAHRDAPQTLPPEIGPACALPYAGSTDHAIDLLRRLDLMLRREVLRRRRSQPQVSGEPMPDWMRYAAVLEEEVDALLLQRTPSVADADAALAEDRPLEVEIAQLTVQRRRELKPRRPARSACR